MRYLKSERWLKEGVETRRPPEEVVDEEYVQRYTALETRRWFEGLGGREEMRRHGGVIYCKSTSPDGDEVHEVVFSPHREADHGQ